jgi:C_GCAxxG_C_C family probable redox protein
VLLAVCQKRNIATPPGVIPQIAQGFGGGIGNTGSVCGAVIGAVMAIGVGSGESEDMQQMLDQLRLSGELRTRFEAQLGSINCRELTGLNLTTEEGVDELMKSDIPERVCMPAVNTAYRLALELLAKDT